MAVLVAPTMDRHIKTKIGDSNNYLKIIDIDKILSKKYKKLYYICKCECGNIKSVRGSHFRNGTIKSCGCKTKMLNGLPHRKHGLERHRLYGIWNMMMQRCYNPNNKKYKNYGARGITVCEDWLNVENFINSLEPSFVEGLTLDRINVNGNYEPSNCRWATQEQQANNKQNTIYIKFKDNNYTIRELSNLLNVKYNLIYSLYYKNKDNIEGIINSRFGSTGTN